jgi:FAD/FMN-containing dehydrogenase
MAAPTVSRMGAENLFEESIQVFKASLRGELLRPDDGGFDDARKVYNAMIDKRPAMIVRCAGVADVIAAVNFAREHDLLVAVRGGGHNVAGNALCDDGMVIDLSGMRAIRVDPASRTARAEAGATYREFDRETQAFGLATTGGTISATGIAGLTLGGGLGWLMRQHGLACDNLLSVDMVLADGRFVTASAEENADLFWGVRGGGGNFGVVTSFEYRVHPVGMVLGGMLIHPLPNAREALRFYRDFSSTAPDELAVFAGLLTTPDGMQVLAFILCYNGPIEEGEAAIASLRQFGPPVADMVQPMPYTVMQAILDDGFPNGLQNYWKSSFLQEISDEAIDTMIASFTAAGSPLAAMVIEHCGGAMARVDKDETAFSHREGHSNLLIISRWGDPSEAEAQTRWARATWTAMQPFSDGGVYSNYVEGGAEGADRVRAAYGDATYDRLAALKKKYDPNNFFRVNQNIKPMV